MFHIFDSSQKTRVGCICMGIYVVFTKQDGNMIEVTCLDIAPFDIQLIDYFFLRNARCQQLNCFCNLQDLAGKRDELCSFTCIVPCDNSEGSKVQAMSDYLYIFF